VRRAGPYTFSGVDSKGDLHMTLREAERDEQGATAVEYGLMVGCIAVAIIIAVAAFGLSVADLFLIPAGTFDGP
jgi:pilus assembly protein Flp/PilA